MSFSLINYIPYYYETVLIAPVPSLVIGKFILIRHEEGGFLVLSPRDFTKYHANIAERFCRDKGLEGGYDAERKRFAFSDKGWSVAGGGKFAIDEKRKTIKLFDDSMVYGKFDAALLREIMKTLPQFSGFSVEMD